LLTLILGVRELRPKGVKRSKSRIDGKFTYTFIVLWCILCSRYTSSS